RDEGEQIVRISERCDFCNRLSDFGFRTSILINRRTFLKTAASVTAATALRVEAPAAITTRLLSGTLIDVNVNLSRWPVRRLRYDDTPALVAMLRSHGVSQAWTGSFDALLHKDIGSVNARLADECRRYGRGLLSPFGSIN